MPTCGPVVEVSSIADDEDDHSPAESRASVASLEVQYAALYMHGLDDRDGAPSDAELDAFARTTGVFTLYPYARAEIQNVTAHMGLPPLTLDVYRIPIGDPTLLSALSP